VLAQGWSAPRRHLRNALHLNRTADRRSQLATSSFERNDNVIRAELRVVDHFLWPSHDAERDVNAIEDFVPMRHRLRAEQFIQNCRQLRHVLNQLGRIGESRIRYQILSADGFRHGR